MRPLSFAQPRLPMETGAPGRDFAVIGSGVAGLSAAWLLSQRHSVTLYEEDSRLGGHSHTVVVDGTPVDTGFIVYNEKNYPNLTALFRHLGVATERSEMTFAVSLDNGQFEYAGDLRGLFAQPSSLLRSDYWAMLRDVLRFYREAPRMLGKASSRRMTLGAYLDSERYSDAFCRLHLLPMGAAIWSSSADAMREHPLHAFVSFFVNHGLLNLAGRPRWRTVHGGSREYVKRLVENVSERRHGKVAAILREGDGVIVCTESGARTRHDGVIIATHADQVLKLLGDASDEEKNVLGKFRYRDNATILHSDVSLMPKRKAAWASWNYLGRSDEARDSDLCVTYWMNRLQNLKTRSPLFVTLNPPRGPREDLVHGVYNYSHPMFDTAALEAQQRLWHLQGVRGTWFCGSYFGSGFHEDALQAGLAAAEDAGGVKRPWSVTNESGRIVLAPQLASVPA
ncbi:MAG TPA: FAD-dependent oxidoreductase [Rhizomicrobium sp.]|nr:FAD-dependent oxidoreductase [Rhizomicrobium sp.]